jgi:S1-C subfamily serine protease
MYHVAHAHRARWLRGGRPDHHSVRTAGADVLADPGFVGRADKSPIGLTMMKTISTFSTFITCVIFSHGVMGQMPPAKSIFATASKSVVLINARGQSKSVQGSGVVFSSGYSKKRSTEFTYILTNAHVAADFSEVTVITPSKTKYVGEVVTYDRGLDLALIRLDGVTLLKAKSRNESGTHLSVGDKVYAIVSPIGMSNSLSEGIVSGLRERKGIQLIQTTAPISKGSSGGGLFDAQGNLVGITTFKLTDGENLNFAVDLRHAASLFKDNISSSAESATQAPRSGSVC